MHTSATAPITIQRIAPVIDSSSVPVMRHRTATSAPEELQIGDDFISITDEDGKEYELEVLAELEHNGSRYLALVPAGSGNDDEEEDLEVSILKSVEENGEEFLEAIEDDAELEEVYSALMDLIYEEDDAPEA